MLEKGWEVLGRERWARLRLLSVSQTRSVLVESTLMVEHVER